MESTMSANTEYKTTETKVGEQRIRLLIIGAGPAGYTAATYAARAGLEPVVLQGLQPGGQLTITTEVENWPASFPAMMGPDLMQKMADQAAHYGARLVFDIATRVDFSARPFRVWTDNGDLYVADLVIIATGAQAKWLGLESERNYWGKGVSACATCDSFAFRNKDVVVIGGGNTAVEEALHLAKTSRSVTLVHRRDTLRSEKILQDRLFAKENVRVLWNRTVDEILGEKGMTGGVTGVRLRSTVDDSLSDVACDGVFVAIGHAPATEVFRGHLDLDADGYIVVKPGTVQTSVDGILAAGDVVDKVYRQAVTAAGMGCMAALDAERALAAH